MNYQYFEKPLVVNDKDSVYCPFIKMENNSALSPQPQTVTGEKLPKLCVPNLSSRKNPGGYGINRCIDNNPVHLNFNVISDCYTDITCETPIKQCYDPY